MKMYRGVPPSRLMGQRAVAATGNMAEYQLGRRNTNALGPIDRDPHAQSAGVIPS